jgi:hypothetical protein
MSEPVVPFFPEAIEREIQTVLKEAGIYNIDSYGWLNENDPDPEFIGHAMWQEDQLSIDYNALINEQPVRMRPDEAEKLRVTAGEDFCGLMEASRLSIGLALLWHRHARTNPWNENPFFWLHHTDAFLKLAVASDRLRELLVVSCTGSSSNSYWNNAKQNRLYVTPFKEAEQLLAARGLRDSRLTQPLESLPTIGAAIFDYVNRRNKIVHEVATRMAKITRDSVSELQERFDQTKKTGFSPRSDYPDDFLHAADEEVRKLQAEIDNAMDELQKWYELLVRASNYVFQVEYWSRSLRRQ